MADTSLSAFTRSAHPSVHLFIPWPLHLHCHSIHRPIHPNRHFHFRPMTIPIHRPIRLLHSIPRPIRLYFHTPTTIFHHSFSLIMHSAHPSLSPIHRPIHPYRWFTLPRPMFGWPSHTAVLHPSAPRLHRCFVTAVCD